MIQGYFKTGAKEGLAIETRRRTFTFSFTIKWPVLIRYISHYEQFRRWSKDRYPNATEEHIREAYEHFNKDQDDTH